MKSIAPGLSALFFLFVVGCASAPEASVVAGYQGESWVSGTPAIGSGPVLIESSASGTWVAKPVRRDQSNPLAEVTIDLASPRQTMVGYGGAFNEKGWVALAALTEGDRQSVLRAFFDPKDGLGFMVGRIPIGANDYALSRYSLDDVPGDWNLEEFSIARDQEALIPYIRSAQAIQPDLQFWASAWSPPGWMKSNGASDSGALIDSPQVYDALARYDLKFLKAYAAEGIPICHIAVQNEPLVLTHYPSCEWTPDQFRTFIGGYLGPLLAREKPDTGVMLGTFNGPENAPFLKAVLSDAKAAGYVSVIGLQWDGDQALAAVGPLAGSIPVYQTETDCGNWTWKGNYNPDYPPNDFVYAAYTWRKIQSYLNAGVVVYDLWNLVLDETGLSIDSDWPWPQNSAVVVDTSVTPGRAHFTPMFYAMGHFSRFSGPGSVRLSVTGTTDAVAFLRPDGTKVVQLLNDEDQPQVRRVRIGGEKYSVELSPHSFGTLLVP